MTSEYPHPDVLEHLGFWRRRRQPKPSEEGGREGNSNQCPSTIFRVPDNIRQDEPTAYEPTVVSIGPLHWSNGSSGSSSSSSNSLAAMEETKRQYVALLLDRRDPRRETGLYDACMNEMKALEEGVRRCYSERNLDHLTHDQFAHILLLDGCFILYHLLKESEDKRSSRKDGISCCEWIQKVGVSCNESIRKVGACCNGLIRRDDANRNIKEMELKRMADSENPKEVGHHNQPTLEDDNEEIPLVIFHLPKHNWRENSFVKYDLLKIENQIPFYVIETLFEQLKTQEDEDLIDITLNFFEVLYPKRAKPLFDISTDEVDHLLQLFHMSIIPQSLPCISKLNDPAPTAMLLDWFPSATELQELGVEFRKGKNEAANFLNLNFSNGVLEMGPIHISNHSSSVFRNLIAFENCSAVPPYITIYAFFMGRIMRTGKDVQLLRSKGIMVNRRGSDEEAALFFDQMCKPLRYPDRSNYLRDIFIEAANYHESTSHGCKAILVRACTYLSIVVAAIGFLLAVVQAFFAAYGYFRPPGSSPSSPPSN